MKVIVIVGDRFEAFAKHPGVMLVGAFEAILEAGAIETLGASVFELGQGVSASRIEGVVRAAGRLGIRERLLFDTVAMCGAREVHKHHAANSVISMPVRVKDDTFEVLVLLDDSGEMLSDHVSGQHLPGMVFVEAARQLCLGVTEAHFPEEAQRSSFLLTSIDVRFLGWAFPLAIKAQYRIVKRERPTAGSTSFAIDVTFSQGGQAVASGNATFELRDRRVVARHEQSLARAALAATMTGPSPSGGQSVAVESASIA